MNKQKVRRVSLPMPKDLNEVDALVAEVAEIDRQLSVADANLKERLAELRDEIKEYVAPLKQQRSDAVKQITKYAKAHRGEIESGDRKSLELDSGTIGWRFGPCKVGVDGEEEAVIEWLKDNLFVQYLRTTVELDREQLLTDRPDFKRPCATVVCRPIRILVQATVAVAAMVEMLSLLVAQA